MPESVRSFEQHQPQLGHQVYIDPSAVVIGDVSLGDDCGIWPQVSIRGDIHRIQVGDRTNIQDGSVLHVTHASDYNPAGCAVRVGNDVTVGHKVLLHGCTIGNHVLVGMGAIVMDGVVVEDEVIIGAGSLVPPGKRLESGHLYVGSPARKARPLTDAEHQYLRYSAKNYVRLKNRYLEQPD